MHTLQMSRLPAAAAAFATLAMLTGAVLAEEQVKGSEIPNNAYYGDKLTPAVKDGITSEEDVTPYDGKASVPPADLQGVIPDASDSEKGDSTVAVPSDDALPGDVDTSKPVENEAEAVIKDSKDNFRVSGNELERCIKQWDPQSQMTKQEWANSCRTTLQYYPEGGGN